MLPRGPSEAREVGLGPGCCLLHPLGSSPLAWLTKTTGACADATSNLNSEVLLCWRDDWGLFLVLGRGEGRGTPDAPPQKDVMASAAAADDEEPSLARATGISSRDSAESEWYSAGGAAAWTMPAATARGGREALKGNAGNGSLWARDTVDTLANSAGGQENQIKSGSIQTETSPPMSVSVPAAEALFGLSSRIFSGGILCVFFFTFFFFYRFTVSKQRKRMMLRRSSKG